MLNTTYLGWSVGNGRGQMLVDGALMQVSLSPSSDGALFEGWWPNSDQLPQERVCVAGICLWDARWQVAFKHEHHNLVMRRSLGIPSERAEAAKRFRQGHDEWGEAEFCHFAVPADLGEYHRVLLTWQAAQFRALNPGRILYHVPRLEYHQFIQQAGRDMGTGGELETALKDALERHIEQVLALQAELLGPDLASRITYVVPLQEGATKVDKSWPYPYLHPEVYGVDPNHLVGVEDLVELRILRDVQKRTGRTVPTRVAVLSRVHPYALKDGEQLIVAR